MESVCTLNVGLRMRIYNISFEAVKFAASFRDDVKLNLNVTCVMQGMWVLHVVTYTSA